MNPFDLFLTRIVTILKEIDHNAPVPTGSHDPRSDWRLSDKLDPASYKSSKDDETNVDNKEPNDGFPKV